MRTAKIVEGDIFEIKTDSGFGHFQVRHFAKGWGHWICVYEGVSATPLVNVHQLQPKNEQFEVYFPLKAAIKERIVRYIGNVVCSESNRAIPTMKSRGGILPNGKVVDWWIIEGEKEWRVTCLSEEQKKLPVRSVINATALIEKIDEGWRPERDPSVS